MKTVHFHRHGGIDVLDLEDAPAIVLLNPRITDQSDEPEVEGSASLPHRGALLREREHTLPGILG